jgi:2-dehydro-3-deoxygluconokinase
MLRLAPPGHERFLQTPNFVATFGGAEANVAVALAGLGQPASFVTALPENPLADACIGELRRFGVDTRHIVRRAGRLGVYYLEHGANQRPSKVIYDRDASAIALAEPAEFDWRSILDSAGWFHVSGITPAISASAAAASLAAVEAAHAAGVPVSIDLNYRKNLWKWGKSASDVMPGLVCHASHIIANEEDIQRALGITADVDVRAGELDRAQYQRLAEKVLAAFPGVGQVAISLRGSLSASHNRWAACVHDRREFVVSRAYEITHIVDRVGSGDSFAAGFIFGTLHRDSAAAAIEFATALSCLKHSVPGDFARITRGEVEALLKEGGSGRVER